MNKIIVSPSILSADFANLERDIKRAEQAGADWIHVDVMDGHFVPNITIGIPVVKAIRKITGLPLDVHLMIENPDKYIVAFAKAGADIITFHYEATCEDTVHVIDLIKKCNVKAGLAIKPKTTQERLYPYLKDIKGFSNEMSHHIRNMTLSSQRANISAYELIDVVEKYNGILK